MAMETVKKLTDAELAAEELEKNARKNAEDSVKAARQKAAEIVEDAKKSAARTMDDAKKRAEDEAVKLRGEFSKQLKADTDKLRGGAAKAKDKVKRIIIDDLARI